MADCQACLSDRHSQCTGLDGPMTTHPDSLPRCTCAHPKSGAATASPEHCPPSEHVDAHILTALGVGSLPEAVSA